jgi:hypothetical protein
MAWGRTAATLQLVAAAASRLEEQRVFLPPDERPLEQGRPRLAGPDHRRAG